MRYVKGLTLFTFVILLGSISSFAQQQEVPIGQWKSFLPYSSPIAVADAGDRVYCANASALFSFNKEDNSYDLLSKVSGLSDIGVSNIFFDYDLNTLVVSYSNSNIDLITGSDIYNFSSVKSSSVTGDKNIYASAFDRDTIIFGCGFGIVLFDFAKKESPATYFFYDTTAGGYLKVNAVCLQNNFIYAATDKGIYRGDLHNNLLEDFGNWEHIVSPGADPEGSVSMLAAFNNKVYGVVNDTVYDFDGASWNYFYSAPGWFTKHISAENGHLIITQIYGTDSPADSSKIITVDMSGSLSAITTNSNLLLPFQSNIDASNIIWVADGYRGLVEMNGSNVQTFSPNGPASSKVFDLDVYDNKVWVAPGEINVSWNYLKNHEGFFVEDYGYWDNVNTYSFSQFDSIYDLITVTVDKNSGKAYFGSFGGGLIEFDKTSNQLTIFKQNTGLQPTPGDTNDDGVEDSYRIGGFAFDSNDNLWISNYAAPKPIVVKTADGNWYNFSAPVLDLSYGNQLGQIVVDQFNQKWIQLPRGGGILVYNSGSDIASTADDQMRKLQTGTGSGNLPTNYVNCLAVDKDGEVWAGTDEGIAVFYNPSEVFSGTLAGDATLPLVDLGGYYEYLLSRETVNSIAVDGANRKWVGTNSGAFLISSDGTGQLLFFNQDNSPLFSNSVLSISIDPDNGDVYFGTDKGICSFRYTATEGAETNSNVKVFPNPVRENYKGPIAISGLVDDADVRITDMSGRMIYQTTALGGQAIWDGNNYNGDRAGTGVYMVFAANSDGSETCVAKILLIN